MLITPIYAAILGLIFVFLSLRTIRLRRKFKVAFGSGEHKLLQRATRVHANFSEYAPLCLILLFFLEQTSDMKILIHVMGSLLIFARILHAYGVSQIKENLYFRITGMILTFSIIISASIKILASYF